jgi:pimeloyl-ACP methyl ester carboxylesterase
LSLLPQLFMEHHRAVFALLRSSRNRRHSGLAQGRSRPGSRCSTALHARISSTASRRSGSVSSRHAMPCAPTSGTWRTPDRKPARVAGALSLEAIRWQYLHGVGDPELVDPDTWTQDHAEIRRPGQERLQLALFADYSTNPPLYPALHEYFRVSRVPLLAVWGSGDQIFGADGARAFTRDLPDAEVHLVDGGGHFLLESHLDLVAGDIRGFLGRVLTSRSTDDRTAA